MAVKDFWGNVSISIGECLEWHMPGLCFYISSERDEWHLVFDRTCSVKRTVAARRRVNMPAGDVRRFVTVSEDKLELLPALPDKPVVVRPDGPIALLPGRHAMFYFSVPLWISFCGGERTRNSVFFELPMVNLSNTWFGDLAAGELCYSLDTHLSREPLDSTSLFEAQCCIHVKNGSTEKLDFTKLCVHVENLSLYKQDDRIYTNTLRVTYKGQDQESQISISPNSPETGGILFRGPRVPANRSIIRKTFDVFRVMTGI